MRAKIVILPSGQLSVFVEEGSFEDGRLAITRLLSELEAQGLDFESIGQAEQHRHAEIREEVRSHARN